MSKSKKLLFVVNVEWFFLSHRLPIALKAIKEGYEVHIATGITNRLVEMESYGLIVHPLSFDRSDSSPFSSFKLLLDILNVYKKVRPDIVHLVTIKSVLIGGLAARIAKIPSVVVAISGLGFTFTDRSLKAKLILIIIERLYRLALSSRNLVVIVQNKDDLATVKKLSQLSDDVFTLLPGSGIDLQEFYPCPYPEGLPVIVMASRMLFSKGVGEFVKASVQLKKEGIKARFVLVGEPDPANPRSLTKEQLESWHQQEIIEWWGFSSKMAETINKSHIIVLPSYYGEGLPKVLIEASACGRAIITTDIPGCRDAIEPNVTGLLVPPKEVEPLAKAMRYLILNPEICLQIGMEARKRAETIFSIDEIVSAHLEIYQKLLIQHDHKIKESV